MSTTELVPEKATIVPPALSDELGMIERAAANPQIDVEKLERMLGMRERLLARQAEIRFNEGMQQVQSMALRVVRDAKNPHTNSRYARLETINKALVPIYTAHGFSLSFG